MVVVTFVRTQKEEPSPVGWLIWEGISEEKAGLGFESLVIFEKAGKGEGGAVLDMSSKLHKTF